MPQSPKTPFVLLGLLSDGPLSGYDIKKQIDESIRHFWNESYGRIYPALRELERAGLVTRRLASNGARRRHQYTITSKGRRALAAWLAQPPEPAAVRNEMTLKVFFGGLTPPGVLRQQANEYRDRAARELGYVRHIQQILRTGEEATDPRQPFWLMVARAGELMMEARIRWSDELVDVLSETTHRPATKPKNRARSKAKAH